MKISLILIFGGVFMAAWNTETAMADPIDFQSLGGSVVNTKSKVGDTKVFLKRDGTYVTTIEGRSMRHVDWDSKGVWRVEGTILCTTAAESLPSSKRREEYCQNIPAKNYGDSWTIDSPNGEVHLTIGKEETDL